MYRATATALALMSFLPRVGLGYQPIDDCCPPPCGCEMPPIVCCDPCEPSAPTKPIKKKDRTKSSGPLPTPAAAKPPTPALNADAISPQPLNTPDIESTVAPPTEPASPAPAATLPQEVAPTEPVPRYAAPPTAAPAAESTRYDDVFSAEPAESETPAPESTTPATTEPAATTDEAQPAEEPPAEEQSPPTESAPTEPAAPATDPFEAPVEETPPAEEPASSSPEGDDLFGPSAAHDVLTQPGGWASNASRPWTDADGNPLVTGHLTEVTAKFVVLLREDGQSQAVRYARLGDEDLSFLRQQIDARRVQLAAQAAGDELLAEQSR